MKAINPFKEAEDAVIEAGGEALKSCYQCGLCTGNCPWNLVRSFITRKLIHQAQFGLLDFESEDLWLCATCGACVELVASVRGRPARRGGPEGSR